MALHTICNLIIFIKTYLRCSLEKNFIEYTSDFFPFPPSLTLSSLPKADCINSSRLSCRFTHSHTHGHLVILRVLVPPPLHMRTDLGRCLAFLWLNLATFISDDAVLGAKVSVEGGKEGGGC